MNSSKKNTKRPFSYVDTNLGNYENKELNEKLKATTNALYDQNGFYVAVLAKALVEKYGFNIEVVTELRGNSFVTYYREIKGGK